MSEGGVRGIVVCHGLLAEGLVDAVRHITGVAEGVLVPLSNRGLSPETMAATIRGEVGDGPAIIFTDLTAGSCGFAARRLNQQLDGVSVVSGVNLPLLVQFVMHQQEPLETLLPMLVEKGRAAICCAPSKTGDHGHSAVSR
jgi:mannose/fructose-specific phosphotransferase system component IIA